MTAALQILDVTKRFGGLIALDKVRLEISPSQITAIIGQNGAGKTTLVNAIMQVVPPDEGRVFAGETELTGRPPDEVVRFGVARSFQQLRLFPHLSVLENILVGMQYNPGESIVSVLTSFRRCRSVEIDMRRRAHDILQQLELQAFADEEASNLSYGLQKMLSLGRLLATNAKILILDEPTSGLSNDFVAKVTGAIRQMRSEEKTVILIEHDMNVVFDLSDHVVVLDQGRLFASGRPEEVRDDERVRAIYLGS